MKAAHANVLLGRDIVVLRVEGGIIVQLCRS